MKYRLSFVPVVAILGIALVSSSSFTHAHAQEPAAAAPADAAPTPAAQDGATEKPVEPTAPTDAPVADNAAAPAEEKVAEEQKAEDKPTEEKGTAEKSTEEKNTEEKPAAEAPAPTTGGAPAAAPSGVAKVIDSNQQAADQRNSVSRTGGMIAGVSLIILIAYFLTRKKAKPNG